MSSSMSMPVDDLLNSLTTSFKANHIGDEAAELAKLQKQLTQALYHANNSASYNQTPNTPTQTNAAWSFSDEPGTGRPRSTSRIWSQPPRQQTVIEEDSDQAMVIDEAEVEDLLAGHTHSSTASNRAYGAHTQHMAMSHTPTHSMQYVSEYPTASSPTSSFIATDPFYASISRSNQTSARSDSHNMIAPQSAFLGQQQTRSSVQTHY